MDVSEEFCKLLGEEVLALVGGRVRKMEKAKTYRAENPGDAVREYTFDYLRSRDGVEDLDVEVIVVEQKLRALAEFRVLRPDGSLRGFYQASLVIRSYSRTVLPD
ncbi:MAG: hypothetical protein F4100_12725 [Rhodothermaceae bacterium]|nr:hypothetical protein [Rhodothermaceae bacterium]MYJ21587.1 hypothetical protein [Rhodothermaceae bacterium]